MNKPLTFGTPEHTAWAKKGEQDGKTNDPFTKLIDELCELIEKGGIEWRTFNEGRSTIREAFDLYEDCECQH